MVRVRATSLSYRERMVLRGDYVLPVTPGIVPLSDGAGEVIGLGPGANRFRVGDRVAANIFPFWHDGPLRLDIASQLGSTLDGLLRDYAVLPEGALVRIPEHLTFVEAATLPCAGVTAWNAVTGGRSLAPGDTLLTLGSGGVSLFAIAFAKQLGARVIATTGDRKKEGPLRDLGADEVINYRSESRWLDAVRKLTSGRGVDLVVDVAGQLNESLQTVAMGGEVAFVGFLAEESIDPVDVKTLFYSSATVRVVATGNRAQFEAMNSAIAQGVLRPVVAQTFSFDQAVEAFSYYEAEAPFGKVAITNDADIDIDSDRP
ncbi:NAD(P)-dependent alcohol dehydrogenase [Nocardia sp. NBC_00511]|uniref:zinc-dependent alcohol dehydrogenase family protein n=1 Tax=Nocardia sp. NBC_00511 TaxID=2903591 RepID=UPI002F914ABD